MLKGKQFVYYQIFKLQSYNSNIFTCWKILFKQTLPEIQKEQNNTNKNFDITKWFCKDRITKNKLNQKKQTEK